MESHLNAAVSATSNETDIDGVPTALPESPSIKERASYENLVGTLKGLTAVTVNCLLAHWYFLPGLIFQRHRIRLAASSFFSRDSTSRATLVNLLRYRLEPTAYFDFDFALKALSSCDGLGDYLDMRSPSLFPPALLSRQHAKSATIVSAEQNIIDLLSAAAPSGLRNFACRDVPVKSLLPDSYDVITSLSWIGRAEDDVGAVTHLWDSLKPGGTLVLSVPCATSAGGEVTHQNPSPAPSVPDSGPFFRRRYDMQLLKTRILDRLDQPKRFAVYGEVTPGSYKRHLLRRDNEGTASQWRDSMVVGRDWRCYPGIEDLPGDGVIAMKFVKPRQRIRS